MKKNVFILLILFIFINCFATENVLVSTFSKGPMDGYSWRQRQINYDITDTNLSKEKLISTIWRMNFEINPYAVLVFYTDDVFRIGTTTAGKSIEGKYKIENGKLILFNYNHDDKNGVGYTLTGDECICTINFSSEHFIYKHELEIQGVKYFPDGSEKGYGESAKINGITVNTIMKNYVFNDTVKFRSEPNLSSDLIQVCLYNELTNGNLITYSFKKGTVVHVLAELPQKETIAGDKGSWCYIRVNDGCGGNQFGWVFGAYFDEYDNSKQKEYSLELQKELNAIK